MEASHSHLTTGELPGGQEHSQPECPHGDPQPKSPSPHRRQQQTPSQRPHGTTQNPKRSRKAHSQCKRLKHQPQSRKSDTMTEGKQSEAAAKTTSVAAKSTTTATSTRGTRVPCPSSGGSAAGSIPAKQDKREGTSKLKRERKPQRPGKYVCSYCGRACAKPSVLQKHIRSHTGERPYPCAPCGFSFKTKSNLYKHRKSHTHRVKAGLAFSEPQSLEEQASSEDEAKQLSSAASSMERQGTTTSLKSHDSDRNKVPPGGMDDSYAVKKRLAMRLSRGKPGLLDSSDDRVSSSILSSRGSTESGYFSRSESTEQSQDSPPNTSAKSYAEIILGKYGRFGHLQRMSRHQNQPSPGEEEKHIPFNMPKKQVIDHITKLITINEAVVDTSKIDSVKPRRFSLSRKSSTESQKSSNIKEPVIYNPNIEESGYNNSGSITMGVPCEKFNQSLSIDPLAPSTGPLLRSQSMPYATSSLEASSRSPQRFCQSQSFEQRRPSQLQASRHVGMLRRQPAIEIPLCAELPKDDPCRFPSFHDENPTTVPDHKPTQLHPYKCEACGAGCKNWEHLKGHTQSLCLAQNFGNAGAVINQVDHPQPISHIVRPGAQAMRKRRKEESFESDDPSYPVACSSPSPAFGASQCREESSSAHKETRRPKPLTFSVIQHTSSFEKQDTSCTGKDSTNTSQTHQEYQRVPQKLAPLQEPKKPTAQNVVHQHNVQVPEIMVTEDSNMDTKSSSEPRFTSKLPEKPEEFQWPERSPTLAQLPIEKLPPKKKRLRLAETVQSSGESSFDSVSLPRSPSQDSSASHASSRSASFEESSRIEMDATSSTPLRRSRAANTLTVPGVHPHREMRRSASEQAPHGQQQGILLSESRSKSFDYSCLSPERSSIGWRERRKCLLIKHSVVRDPEEEDERAEDEVKTHSALMVPGPSSAVHCERSLTSLLSEDTVSGTPTQTPRQELSSQWKLSQNIQLKGRKDHSPVDGRTVGPVSDESSPVQTGVVLALSTQCLQQYPGKHGLSGAARAHYLPMSTGLKLEIPTQTNKEYSSVQVSPLPISPSLPNITTSPELLRRSPFPMVVVRLQADTLTPACAIYTTQSQTSPARPFEPMSIISQAASSSTSAHRGRSDADPEFQAWSEDLLRSPGSGGNKRMLSPSSSIELSQESQQQQKRVKEEEEGGVNTSIIEEGDKQEPRACSPPKPIVTSFPSLQSTTCNSWCYLNYVKPNPFALDGRRPSVYASWSTGGYNPNPPGLSSKMALSLLHCKQSLSTTVYTTSPMCSSSSEATRPEDMTEVRSSPSCDGDHGNRRDEASSAEGEEKEEREEGGEEEEQSCANYRHQSQQWTREEGSCRTFACVYGRGEQAGNLAEQMKWKAGKTHHKEACSTNDTDEGVSAGRSFEHAPEDREHVHLEESIHASDVNKRQENVNNAVRGSRDPPSDAPSASPAGRPCRALTQTSQQSFAGSAGARRALFARCSPRRTTLTSPAGSPAAPEAPAPLPARLLSPSEAGSPPLTTEASPTPPRSPRPGRSPRPPRVPPPTISPHSAGLNVYSSPVRAHSPEGGRPLNRGPLSSSASSAGSSAQTCPPRADQPTTGTSANRLTSWTPLCLHPSTPPPRLLSHLPLHSQWPCGGAPGLTIAIGGIHMIHPQRAPPYPPLGAPALDQPPPPCRDPLPPRGGWDSEEDDGGGGGPFMRRCADQGKHTAGRETRHSQGGDGTERSGDGAERSGDRADTLTQGGMDAHVTQRQAHPDTHQEQRAPSSQTQL